ncbi:MAG: signal peptide peptidase SppA [Ignisphaera sp.]
MRRRSLFIVIGIAVGIAIVISYLLVWSFVQISIGYIAIVKLEGTIGYSRGFLSSVGITPDDVRRYVEILISDPAAKAVVVIVNSPGGSASASEEIYQYIKKLAEVKTVVVYSPETLASGGYYIALPAHKIIVSPYAFVGSIGAVSIVLDVEDLLKNIGINVTIIKSGEYKDIGSIYRSLTADEYKIFSELVNKSAELFIERVKENRPNVVSEVFTARVYLGIDSVKVGLADDIGTLEYAISIARKLANLPQYTPTRIIERPKGLLEILLSLQTSFTENTLHRATEELFLSEFQNKILFLWIK